MITRQFRVPIEKQIEKDFVSYNKQVPQLVRIWEKIKKEAEPDSYPTLVDKKCGIAVVPVTSRLFISASVFYDFVIADWEGQEPNLFSRVEDIRNGFEDYYSSGEFKKSKRIRNGSVSYLFLVARRFPSEKQVVFKFDFVRIEGGGEIIIISDEREIHYPNNLSWIFIDPSVSKIARFKIISNTDFSDDQNEIKERDSLERVIHRKTKEIEFWRTYHGDSNKKCWIKMVSPEGEIEEEWYDERGRVIHKKSKDKDIWFEYDDKGQGIFQSHLDRDIFCFFFKDEEQYLSRHQDGEWRTQICKGDKLIYVERRGHEIRWGINEKGQKTIRFGDKAEATFDNKNRIILHEELETGSKIVYEHQDEFVFFRSENDDGIQGYKALDKDIRALFERQGENPVKIDEMVSLATLIYSKSKDLEEWYDDKGNTIHRIYLSSGFEEWFDDNGNRIKTREPSGKITQFNKHGQKTRMETNGGWETFEYHSNKKLAIHTKSNGQEIHYSIFGDVLYQKTNKGEEKRYDERGNMIYEKDHRGFEYWREFDEMDFLTYEKTSDFELLFFYDQDILQDTLFEIE